MKGSGSSFTAKAGAAVLLAALADWLFYGQWVGATLGVFALAWALVVILALPSLRRRGGALFAAFAAILFAVALIDNPTPLAWGLFWVAVSSAALLSRARFGDAFRWFERLVLHIGFGTVRLFADLFRFVRIRGPRRGPSLAATASILVLPVVGGAMFLALFASANPLIADVFNRITIPSPVSSIPHLIVFAFVLFGVWPSLRPHPRVTGTELGAVSLEGLMPSFPAATVALSLLTFNAVFALQNVLDIIFLWSGARLPGTITMADYAHRGAYSLIATVLVSALFVLTVLRAGSPAARNPAIRLLVALWIAQNLLLVASSILRTLDYIDSYSLTVMRIAALGWMGLVGVGLVLICWRLLAGRSAAWLINANALAAGLALAAACAVDLPAVAAGWNVRHAREAGGPGQPIDLCYLRSQGPSALLPLIELETRVTDPGLRDRVRAIREEVMAVAVEAQSDWHAWTWRGARRLAAAQAALGPNPAHSVDMLWGRHCNGAPVAEYGPDPDPATMNVPTGEEGSAPAEASPPSPAAPSRDEPRPARESEPDR
ncbi:MAG: DUF4173 domain-containing protein [Pseudomonadota bacterium]